ncbi:MAG TPA: chemotaxis protein CheC [Bacillota bacterium]|nr:chemotaxis protein CheC [Bacillota bacterium]
MVTIENLSNVHLDVLKEIGNIGAGHAATALSQLMSERIEMTVPNVSILTLSKVSDFLGGPEKNVVGIYMKVFGDAPGKIMFLFNYDDAQTLVKIVNSKTLPGDVEIEDLDQSVLQEISNIMTGAYLNAISRLTGLNMLSSVPAYACDMAGAIINSALLDFGMVGDYAMLIDTQFKMTQEKMDGHFFLIPDPGSLQVILEAIGV